MVLFQNWKHFFVIKQVMDIIRNDREMTYYKNFFIFTSGFIKLVGKPCELLAANPSIPVNCINFTFILQGGNVIICLFNCSFII
jgi:hypothetical protein